jgi:hypothetical protein
MSMRVNTFVTHLRPEDAYTIIKFIDQLRDVLMQNYGDDIRMFLQDVMPPPETGIGEEDDEVF